MTEGEAKTKWCPFARTTFRDDGDRLVPSYNRFGDADSSDAGVEREGADIRCIGSACMAWRVEYVMYNLGERQDVGGYCGLAGAPQ